MQKQLYKITDKSNSRKIAEFLSKDSQLLLPFLDLICNTEQAVELLSDEIGGDDVITGGTDDDVMYGQFGNDTYVFAGYALGSDTIIEAGGQHEGHEHDYSPNDSPHDVLDFSNFNGPVDVDLDTTHTQIVSGEGHGHHHHDDHHGHHDHHHHEDIGLEITLSSMGIEDVIGSTFDDVLKGNSSDNTLLGLAGDDYLDGKDGDDILIGGDGDDKLKGGKGEDLLDGGAGNDDLKGDDGDDILSGGQSDDKLSGGKGEDILDGIKDAKPDKKPKLGKKRKK